MSLNFPFAVNAVLFVMVVCRLGAFLFAFPMFSNPALETRYKVFFIAALAVMIMPVLPGKWDGGAIVAEVSLATLAFMVAAEICLGLAVALFVMLPMEVLRLAGLIIDRSMGFAMARTVDPNFGGQSGLIANILSQAFFVYFLVANAHLEVVRVTVHSFERVAPGGLILDPMLAESAIEAGSQMFSEGLKIAMPIFVLLLFVNIGMGLMARVGQDFPVLMLSFPLRIGVGLLVLISIMPVIISMYASIIRQIFSLVDLVM